MCESMQWYKLSSCDMLWKICTENNNLISIRKKYENYFNSVLYEKLYMLEKAIILCSSNLKSATGQARLIQTRLIRSNSKFPVFNGLPHWCNV